MPEVVATVKNIGAGLTYQDPGRLGWSRYGIAPAGSMDTHAFTMANKLLGNHPNSTCLEITMGCIILQFEQDCWVALTGAADSKQLPTWSAQKMRKGETLTINPVQHGIWSYLAFPGGLMANKIFGSSSRHERSRLGQAIAKGSSLYLDSITDPYPGIGCRRLHPSDIRDYSRPPTIRVCPGPHDIPQDLLSAFFDNAWAISQHSDRTGFRLEGPELSLERSIHSLPVIPGTIQLPPSGQPIVTLNDGPTCGGYPILGVIHPDDLSYFVQHAPRTLANFSLV